MSNGQQLDISVELMSRVEQFLYRESRLLDDRQFQQWQELLAEDIRYTVPSRHTPWLDRDKRDTEALLNVEQELSRGTEAPYRDENLLTLSIRVMRAYKLNSWTDNPPARTTRFVSNIEVQQGDTADTLQVFSNVLVSHSRHQQDNHLFTARRKDLLRIVDEGFRLARREVILDWNIVTGPSLGIFF